MNRIYYSIAVIGMLAVVGLRPAIISGARWQGADAGDEVREQVNQSSFAMILGEIRASAADLMWVKTERYLHRGVALSPHIDADAMAHNGQVAVKHDDDKDEPGHHHHGELHTLIPDSAEDYRGFIGTLQRQVQPWRDASEPDVHSESDELLPWYRMLTYTNPHHWRGYLIGSWWLSREGATLAQAEAFVNEGVKNNPNCFQLELMRGRVLMQRSAWAEAIVAFRRAAMLAEKVRPEGGKETPAWADSDEEDYAAALRFVPLLEWRKLNQPEAARVSLAQAMKKLPADKPLSDMNAQLNQK